MDAKNKMKRMKFGRCFIKGHGKRCYCEVCDDIQHTPVSRATIKKEIKKEIKDQLKDS